MEKTFIMIKPDGVKRGLVGEIISRIEKKGFKIIQAKLFEPSRALVEEHYEEHLGKVFFNDLINSYHLAQITLMDNRKSASVN